MLASPTSQGQNIISPASAKRPVEAAEHAKRLSCLSRSTSMRSKDSGQQSLHSKSSWTESTQGEADDEGSQASSRQKATPKSAPVEKMPGRWGASAWKPPVHPKSPEQMAQLKEVISNCFLMRALPDKEVKHILQAMRGPHHVLPGMEVIRQGMLVDNDSAGLYVVEQGQLSAFVCTNDAPHPGDLVQMYDQIGQSFGELAIVFKCPRSATVVAQTESKLWSLDRDSFNHLLRDSYLDIRRRCKELLPQASASLSEEISDLMSDGMQLRSFEKGQLIARMRRRPFPEESSPELFIVEHGHATSSCTSGASRRYAPSEMFGTPLETSPKEPLCEVFAGESPTVCATLNAQASDRMLTSLAQLKPDCVESDPSEASLSLPALVSARSNNEGRQAEQTKNLNGGDCTSTAHHMNSFQPKSSTTATSSWWPLFCGCAISSRACCKSTTITDAEAYCDAVPVIDDGKLR